MISKRAFRNQVIALALTKENIQREAYRIWQLDGEPDGEQQDPHFPCMKIKERHWLVAKMVLELTAEFDADFIYNQRLIANDL